MEKKLEYDVPQLDTADFGNFVAGGSISEGAPGENEG